MTVLEVCLEDVGGAAVAERHGADRIELCTDLAHGGTTPSLGTVSQVLDSITGLGLQLLIRSRPGDFVYTADELRTMVGQIEAIRSLPRPPGVTVGFVIGALTRDGEVDRPAIGRLLTACGSAPVTFHRAFDEIADRSAALETLVDLGFDRVLTSGGQPTAAAGIGELARLVTQAGDRISILAAGSVRAHNVADIVRRTGVSEVHLRATTDPQSSSTSAAVVEAVVAELHRPDQQQA